MNRRRFIKLSILGLTWIVAGPEIGLLSKKTLDEKYHTFMDAGENFLITVEREYLTKVPNPGAFTFAQLLMPYGHQSEICKYLRKLYVPRNGATQYWKDGKFIENGYRRIA